MPFDAETAVIVCAGASLDGLTAQAWSDIGRAGAVVAVNGAAAAEACARNGVRFTCLAAMDLAKGLAGHVAGLADVWHETPAWRVASTESVSIDAESYIVEVDEEHGIHGWSDDSAQGYKGGSTAMIVGNWLGNDWPDDGAARDALERIRRHTGKAVPRRGFRRIAYVGLDMHPGVGVHARGAGEHTSGFAASAARYGNVSLGWEKFCREAERRGIDVRNFTPGTGLQAMRRGDVPRSWVP